MADDKALRKVLHDILVDKDMKIKRDYEYYLAPFAKVRDAYWPANQIGCIARVSSDYLDCWVNFGELEDMVKRESPLVRSVPSHELIGELRSVVASIGMESYSPEWKDNVSQEQLKDKIERSTDITVLINKLLSEIASSHLIEVFDDIEREKTFPTRHESYTVLDLGCGAFGMTIVNHMKRLHALSLEHRIPSNYADYVKPILFDIDSTATYMTSQRLLNPRQFGYDFNPPRQKIDTINSNFSELDRHPYLVGYEGRIDTILSGAALCHVTDPRDVFRFMHYLASGRGAIFLWDWLAKTFAAPYLRLPRVGEPAGGYAFDVWGKNLGKVRIYADSLAEPPKNLYSLQKGNKWKATYLLRDEDINPHHSNMYAWLGYWDFIRRDDAGVVSQGEISGIPIWEHYLGQFNRKVMDEDGYSPIHDFVIGTLVRGRKKGLSPFGSDRVKYNFIESYGPEYARKMRDAGMHAVDVPFEEFYGMQRSNGFSQTTRMLNDTQKEVSSALRFTIAAADRLYLQRILASLGKGR